MSSIILQSKQIERLDYIDVLKGIGILYMIMGHVFFGFGFDYYIHAFHMPIFFFTSGFCHTPVSGPYRKRLHRLFIKFIVPYLGYGVFIYVIWVVFFSGMQERLGPLKRLMFMNEDGLAICGALWFLTALFWATIFFEIIERNIQNERIRLVLTGSIAVAGTYYCTITGGRLPWGIDIAFVGIGFMYIGNMTARYWESLYVRKQFKLKTVIIVLGVMVNALLIMKNKYINMRTADYEHRILFWINAVCAILLYISISQALCKYKNYKSGKKRAVMFLEAIGKNSMPYLCLNQLFIVIYEKLFHQVFILNNLNNWLVKEIRAIVILCMTVMSIYAYHWFIKRVSIKHIMGNIK